MANNNDSYDKGGDIDLAPAKQFEDKGGEALLSKPTADAASAEISKLLATNIAIEREDSTRIGSVTLEDMARDLMRPLIKSWLDQNLPKLIEKAVAKEIEKLSRRVAGE
jgi:cell pole-organizing protein PopZ